MGLRRDIASRARRTINTRIPYFTSPHRVLPGAPPRLGLLQLSQYPVGNPVGVPPFDGIDHLAVDQHREVQVIAARETGLGLLIARQIIEKHGGTIELDSEEGRGTRFIIHLPRHHARSAAAPRPTEPER